MVVCDRAMGVPRRIAKLRGRCARGRVGAAMVNPAENELLTRTGPGAPMGNLFRRFWLPALLPSELPNPDSDPIRFRILGNVLIAFPVPFGTDGFLQHNCP